MNFQLDNNLETTAPAGPFFAVCCRTALGIDLSTTNSLHSVCLADSTLISGYTPGKDKGSAVLGFTSYEAAAALNNVNKNNNPQYSHTVVTPADPLHVVISQRFKINLVDSHPHVEGRA
ncbi:hypothetical protein DV711_06205 [Motiliproteus coralliicola]|uniref:Uncharacterized protein n=1 Tax=Motiliproteus coralliicola TaxID=2283196 RepID=A0A369X046_9GAMM|nr:hypothetical protein DV711_06205 [Motiliproteus coralliicola]